MGVDKYFKQLRCDVFFHSATKSVLGLGLRKTEMATEGKRKKERECLYERGTLTTHQEIKRSGFKE